MARPAPKSSSAPLSGPATLDEGVRLATTGRIDLSPDAKRDYVIDHVMPWYVAFYSSWRRAQATGRLNCLFVRYEDLIADKPGTLAPIAAFLGLNKTDADCRAAADAGQGNKGATRFNKGVAGRGAASLSDVQQARLKRIAVPFASTDFGPVGL